MAILFKADTNDPKEWLEALETHLPGRELRIYPDVGRKEDIDYALVYAPPPGLLKSLKNLKAVFSLWAGVDHLKSDPDLPDLPVVRMVEAGMTGAMVEFIVGRVIAWNRRFDEYAGLQHNSKWQALAYRAPAKTRVGILGLGELGLSTARALQAFGYHVSGWSRSPKSIEDLPCHAG